MLKEVDKVEVVGVDKMVGLVMALVPVLGMVRLVGMGRIAEGTLRVVVKVEVVVVGKVVQVAADMGMAQEAVLDPLVVAVDTPKTFKLQKRNSDVNILTSLYYGSCADVLCTHIRNNWPFMASVIRVVRGVVLPTNLYVV
jgi:hypothetical protein